jgi:hypothetical protein
MDTNDTVFVKVLAKTLGEEATKELKQSVDFAKQKDFSEANYHAGIALGLTRANDLMTELFVRQ